VEAQAALAAAAAHADKLRTALDEATNVSDAKDATIARLEAVLQVRCSRAASWGSMLRCAFNTQARAALHAVLSASRMHAGCV
jgi:hypothetical protein